MTRRFWKVGVNDEIWVATTVDVRLGLRMNDDLISPTIVGGGETWLVHVLIFSRANLDSISLWVVVICWDLRNRFGSLLINC